MAKANKAVKTAGKAASVKSGKTLPKGKPILRAIKGGKKAVGTGGGNVAGGWDLVGNKVHS